MYACILGSLRIARRCVRNTPSVQAAMTLGKRNQLDTRVNHLWTRGRCRFQGHLLTLQPPCQSNPPSSPSIHPSTPSLSPIASDIGTWYSPSNLKCRTEVRFHCLHLAHRARVCARLHALPRPSSSIADHQPAASKVDSRRIPPMRLTSANC